MVFYRAWGSYAWPGTRDEATGRLITLILYVTLFLSGVFRRGQSTQTFPLVFFRAWGSYAWRGSGGVTRVRRRGNVWVDGLRRSRSAALVYIWLRVGEGAHRPCTQINISVLLPSFVSLNVALTGPLTLILRVFGVVFGVVIFS